VPPFTAGVPSTTSFPSSSLIRPRLDDRHTNVQNLSKEQTYGMLTSMMANVHNSASAFPEQENLFTTHTIHSPSSSSIFLSKYYASLNDIFDEFVETTNG